MSSRLFWAVIVFVCLSSSARAGYVEICKDSIPADSLSGVYFNFTVAGQTFDAPVGACTQAFEVPDGTAVITEVPQDGAAFYSVSAIGVDAFGEWVDRLISFDPATASATVEIVAGDISMQTFVTFTNTPVPEPGVGLLFTSGLTVWAFRRNWTKRPLRAALRNAANSAVRRAFPARQGRFL